MNLHSILPSSLKMLLFLATLIGLSAHADSTIWSADKAAQALQDDEIILLDIRSPDEWKETGLAKGAWPVSLHQPGFGEKLGAIMRANEDKTVALICATGGRSASVLSRLKGMGISNFVDVSEGMLGSRAGPGWIKRGYAIVQTDEARATLAEAMPQLP
jgi:rhodanese-related sulfurtransferase